MSIVPDYQAFGDCVRTLRTGKVALTQKEFADLVLMDRSYISGIECGHRNPTLDIIVKLANGLGVHPAELLKPLPKVPARSTSPTAP